MNTTRFLIVVSLAANVLLLTALVRQHTELTGRTEATVTVNESDAFDTRLDPLRPLLADGDLAAVVANLRAAEIPSWFIRAVVTAEIDERFRAREEALTVKPDQPNWWQWQEHEETLETRLARARLHRDKAGLRRQILGPNPDLETDQDSPIPPEKREEVAIIAEDFAAIIDSIRDGADGLLLPSEKAAIEMLENERRRELSELLSTEHLAEYELRRSAAFGRLQQQLRFFDASESEFRSLLELEQSFDERFPSDLGTARTPDEKREHWRARNRLQSQANELLGGSERSKQYARAIDREYVTMRELAARAGEPREVVERWFDLRDAFVEESARIRSDANLSGEDKRAAISALAGDLSGTIDVVFGTGLGGAYKDMARTWMKHAADGRAVRFHSEGSISFRASP